MRQKRRIAMHYLTTPPPLSLSLDPPTFCRTHGQGYVVRQKRRIAMHYLTTYIYIYICLYIYIYI